jgi:putative transposase
MPPRSAASLERERPFEWLPLNVRQQCADFSTVALSSGSGAYGRGVAQLRRSDLPDGFFHVYARGVCGIGPIFGDREDHETFFRFLRIAARRHAWKCHAFCVLSTHYHLVLAATRPQLSEGCEELNWNYATYFNRKHERFGHLFAERFSSRVIESEEYLYDACAYVLLNPVKAGLCSRTEDWPWSWSRYGLHSV